METRQPNQFMVVMNKIWPTIYKVINGTVYFLVTTMKSIVKACIDQIKGSF